MKNTKYAPHARLALGALGILLSAATASAQPQRFSLTVSPAHLASPIADLSFEHRALPRFSWAVIGGIGRMKVEENRPLFYEGGGQLRYYPLAAGRHGPHVGIEALFRGTQDELIADASNYTIEGLAAGPLAGYKYTARNGFTAEFQIGYSIWRVTDYGWLDANPFVDGDTWILNFNVGYSFPR